MKKKCGSVAAISTARGMSRKAGDCNDFATLAFGRKNLNGEEEEDDDDGDDDGDDVDDGLVLFKFNCANALAAALIGDGVTGRSPLVEEAGDKGDIFFDDFFALATFILVVSLTF